MAAAPRRVGTRAGHALSMTARGQLRVQLRVHYYAYFKFCCLLLALLCHHWHYCVINGTYVITDTMCSVILRQHWHYYANCKLYVLRIH